MFGFKARRLAQAKRDALETYDEAQRLRTAASERYDAALKRRDTRGVHAASCDLAEATTAVLRLEVGR